MQHRPQPLTAGDEYLALVLSELERQGEVLAQIRDRLPAPRGDAAAQPAPDAPAEIELREPEPAPSRPTRKAGGRRTGNQ